MRRERDAQGGFGKERSGALDAAIQDKDVAEEMNNQERQTNDRDGFLGIFRNFLERRVFHFGSDLKKSIKFA